MPVEFNAEFLAKWNACKQPEDLKALLSTIGPYAQVIAELDELYATELGKKPPLVKSLVSDRKDELLHYIYETEPKVAAIEKRPDSNELYIMRFTQNEFETNISKLPGAKEVMRQEEAKQLYVYAVLPKLPIVQATDEANKVIVDVVNLKMKQLVATAYHAFIVSHGISEPPP